MRILVLGVYVLFLSENVDAHDADAREYENGEVYGKADIGMRKDVVAHPAKRIKQINEARYSGALLRDAEGVEHRADGREDLGKGAGEIPRDGRADDRKENKADENGGVRSAFLFVIEKHDHALQNAKQTDATARDAAEQKIADRNDEVAGRLPEQDHVHALALHAENDGDGRKKAE